MTNDDWRIDTSTGTKILMYKDCSVIEDAQADLLMSLLSQPQEAVACRYKLKRNSKWNVTDDKSFAHALLRNLGHEEDSFEIEDLYTSQPNDKAEIARLRKAIEHIARVAIGTASRSRRALWIHERAKSALNIDEKWRDIPTPKGYHNSSEHPMKG